MQRDGSGECTTPSSLTRMASTGHTWAQGATGSTQCMQTVGRASVELPRSRKSRFIIDFPRCESHSRHAATHAPQAMQRDGSTKIDRSIVIGWEPPSRRSEEHTSELQSLMRIPYAVFRLKRKKNKTTNT